MGSKYATREHRAWQKRARAEVDRGEGWCCELVCLMGSRFIAPYSAVDVAHAPDGLSYLGPAHARCNRSEAATRGNRMRKAPRRWVL